MDYNMSGAAELLQSVYGIRKLLVQRVFFNFRESISDHFTWRNVP